jgi:hypothetical protein
MGQDNLGEKEKWKPHISRMTCQQSRKDPAPHLCLVLLSLLSIQLLEHFPIGIQLQFLLVMSCFSDLSIIFCSPKMVSFGHSVTHSFIKLTTGIWDCSHPWKLASRGKIGQCPWCHNKKKPENLIAQTSSFDLISITQKSWGSNHSFKQS